MPQQTRANPVQFGVLVLSAVILIGGALIYAYLERVRERDLNAWQIRLGLIADSRVEAIGRQLTADFAGLEELANNASLQLYVNQLGAGQESGNAVQAAQLGYLRNLILAAAQREGLLDANPAAAVGANLPQTAHQGLALVDAQGNIVMATPAMPKLQAAHRQALQRAMATAERRVVDLHLDAAGRAALGYVVPVHGVQGAQEKVVQGALLAIKGAERGIYPLLQSSALLTDQDETLLLRQDNGQVRYLSPRQDGGPPLQRPLSMDSPDLAAAYALRHPGQFQQARDYRGKAVLMTSRSVPELPWTLLQKTELHSAMREARQHRRFLLTSFSLLLFFITASLVAAWRHGSSVRAQQNATVLRNKTLELDAQTRLLHGITDNIDAYTALLNADQALVFANTPFANTTGITVTDLAGKSLAAVLGPDSAAALAPHIDAALASGTTQQCTLTLYIGRASGVYQCAFVALTPSECSQASLLLVMHDISELQEAQQRRTELMRKLVGTLMHVVDLHDPHTSHHSERMVEVANAIGAAMELNAADAQVLDLAANLANLGKIFVPKEILTKTAPLSDAEQELVKRHVQYGVEMLEDLQFEGPVLDTIRQKQEHIDGSGYPAGLKGEQLLLSARILAVANAFVALMSPRAYRDAISVRQSLDALLREAGTRYDRQVVAALFHVAENRVDWAGWQEVDD